MDATEVRLTPEERKFLIEILESALKNTLVEEHRTRVPAYREGVLKREELTSQVLGKLKGTTE